MLIGAFENDSTITCHRFSVSQKLVYSLQEVTKQIHCKKQTKTGNKCLSHLCFDPTNFPPSDKDKTSKACSTIYLSASLFIFLLNKKCGPDFSQFF